MENLPPCYGIIPARYASSRFPGKPLADILGKPMFWHVWTRASRCTALESVTMATDDVRIADTAASLGVPCIMTSSEHPSGTDRVYEAACILGIPNDAVVVNIQGDEPALDPLMLTELVRPFTGLDIRVSTLAHEISPQEALSPDRVKLVRSGNGTALYFSRFAIPYDRAAEGAAYLGHIGLYAFRLEALRRFTELEPSRLERSEKLEQLRFLENNIPIYVALIRGHSQGVDKPEDLQSIVSLLEAQKV